VAGMAADMSAKAGAMAFPGSSPVDGQSGGGVDVNSMT